MVKKIKLCRYHTINECLCAFFRCDNKAGLSQVKGYFRWADCDGNEYKQDVQEAIVQIRKRACWGWVDNKEIIHVFIRKRATFRQVLHMLAHEIGHTQRPWHRDLREEQKAEKYAEVAIGAWDITTQLLK